MSASDCCTKSNLCQKNDRVAATLGSCRTVRGMLLDAPYNPAHHPLTVCCLLWIVVSAHLARSQVFGGHLKPSPDHHDQQHLPPPIPAMQCVEDDKLGCNEDSDCCGPNTPCNGGRCGWVLGRAAWAAGWMAGPVGPGAGPPTCTG